MCCEDRLLDPTITTTLMYVLYSEDHPFQSIYMEYRHLRKCQNYESTLQNRFHEHNINRVDGIFFAFHFN